MDPTDPDEQDLMRLDDNGGPIYANWEMDLVAEKREELLRKFNSKLMSGVSRVYSTPEATEFFGRSSSWMYYHLEQGTFTYPPVWHWRENDEDNWRACEHDDGRPFVSNDDFRGHTRFINEKTDQTVNMLGTREREVIGQEEKIWRDVNSTNSFRYFGDPIEPIMIGNSSRLRYTVDILRSMATACYRRGLIKLPELTIILGRLLVAEHGEEAQALIDAGIYSPWDR